jgi:hypothetical protein
MLLAVGFFYMPHVLQHVISDYIVSSEGLATMSHSEIQTHDVRIIRSLHHHPYHCATQTIQVPQNFTESRPFLLQDESGFCDL